MARKKRHEEHVNHERWLVSYADFITLLFAFFVVMYAISSINEGKYRVLSDSLIAAFDNPPKSLMPVQVGNEGVTAPPTTIKTKKARVNSQPSVIDQLRQTAQSNMLGQIANDVEQAMSPLIEDNLIKVRRNDLWLEVEINTSILFSSGESELQRAALPVLRELAGILKKYPNQIQVEGFTDNLPINTLIYPSNWELSAARSASVVHLFMNAGVEPERMAAVGFGEYQPVADNATSEGREKNRRVVLVILADANARRALDIQRKRRPAVASQAP